MATHYVHLLPALRRLAATSASADLAQVGRDVQLSPGRAQRVFSALLGESPKRFQQRVRLDRGALLLLGSDLAVAEVAMQVGFESHEGFTRAFSRRFAMPPTAYRVAYTGGLDDEQRRIAAAAAPCVGLYRRAITISTTTQANSQRHEENRQSMSTGYDIERRTIAPTPFLFGTRRIDIDKMAEVLAEVLPAAFGYAMANGLAMAGPPVVRYTATSPAFVTVDAGVPLAEAPPVGPDADSGLTLGALTGGDAAVTVHRGPYDTLGEAHAALDRWMADNDVSPADVPWETYLTDPTEVPDPADWLTQVTWPIV